MIIATRDIEESHKSDLLTGNCVPADKLLVLKTSSKPRLVVFSQLGFSTSGTSLGSAKVMSTHYSFPQFSNYEILYMRVRVIRYTEQPHVGPSLLLGLWHYPQSQP